MRVHVTPSSFPTATDRLYNTCFCAAALFCPYTDTSKAEVASIRQKGIDERFPFDGIR